MWCAYVVKHSGAGYARERNSKAYVFIPSKTAARAMAATAEAKEK
jgi:hypothetical protein